MIMILDMIWSCCSENYDRSQTAAKEPADRMSDDL